MSKTKQFLAQASKMCNRMGVSRPHVMYEVNQFAKAVNGRVGCFEFYSRTSFVNNQTQQSA